MGSISCKKYIAFSKVIHPPVMQVVYRKPVYFFKIDRNTNRFHYCFFNIPERDGVIMPILFSKGAKYTIIANTFHWKNCNKVFIRRGYDQTGIGELPF